MPRDLPIGNGNVLIAFDRDYRLRELYFPHVGEENHTRGEPFRFGVYTEGQFKWVSEGWQITKDYLDDSLVTDVEMVNKEWNLRIIANDLVDFQENLYLKKLTVYNLSDEDRKIRLFFAQDFHIYGNNIGVSKVINCCGNTNTATVVSVNNSVFYNNGDDLSTAVIDMSSGGGIAITNTTIANNRNSRTAVWLRNFSTANNTLTNVTIAGNSSAHPTQPGGLEIGITVPVTIGNSIIANNFNA